MAPTISPASSRMGSAGVAEEELAALQASDEGGDGIGGGDDLAAQQARDVPLFWWEGLPVRRARRDARDALLGESARSLARRRSPKSARAVLFA